MAGWHVVLHTRCRMKKCTAEIIARQFYLGARWWKKILKDIFLILLESWCARQDHANGSDNAKSGNRNLVLSRHERESTSGTVPTIHLYMLILLVIMPRIFFIWVKALMKLRTSCSEIFILAEKYNNKSGTTPAVPVLRTGTWVRQKTTAALFRNGTIWKATRTKPGRSLPLSYQR